MCLDNVFLDMLIVREQYPLATIDGLPNTFKGTYKMDMIKYK